MQDAANGGGLAGYQDEKSPKGPLITTKRRENADITTKESNLTGKAMMASKNSQILTSS